MKDKEKAGPEAAHETAADKKLLITAMEAAGYYYDPLESRDDCLRFTSDYGNIMMMDSWKECEEWLNGVVFDDPEVSDQVERILHPEHFVNADTKESVHAYLQKQRKSTNADERSKDIIPEEKHTRCCPYERER